MVILVDTLRADRVGAYQPARRLTPFIDSLAASGVVFEHAYAQSSWTIPSVASLFTSRYQTQHGLLAFGASLNATEVTLAETLQGAGYATACVTANAALAFKTGFDQGFGHFRVLAVEANAKARADAVNAAAFAWLDANAGRPAFLYLHYMEPHLPYSPSPEALDRVLGGRPRPDLKAASASMMMAITMPPTPERLRDIQDVYDAEVASLDDGLRALVAGLETRGVLRDALVVVTADHGEELQDHGGMGHGVSLYNAFRNSEDPNVKAQAEDVYMARMPVGPVGFGTETALVVNARISCAPSRRASPAKSSMAWIVRAIATRESCREALTPSPRRVVRSFETTGKTFPSCTSATRSLTVLVPMSMTARRMAIE